MSAVSRNNKAKKPIDILQRRIPENPKYKNVRPTVDTGASLTKYMNKIEEIKKNYKFGKDEIFKRMKATTFVQLLIQVQRLIHADDYDDIPPTPSTLATDRPDTADLEIRRLGNGSPAPSLALTDGDFGGRGEPESSRSTLLSVAQGIGELDLNRPPASVKAQPLSTDLCPYLLLDIRDKDEYDQCHILSAMSYPKANLSKAVNYETKDMLTYRNKEGKVIIIYDDDERLGPIAATTLVQRGYDNLFMLSGGLKVSYKLFPEGLVSGTPSATVLGVKPKTITPATRNYFTNDDIDKIEIYLDNALQDKSSGSRLSKASTSSSRQSTSRSNMSSASSRMSSVMSDRPVFKP